MNDNELYETLGLAIAKRRKALGMTQSDLAREVGKSRASIANMELGRQKVLLDQVYKLATALKLSNIQSLIPIEVALSDKEFDIDLSSADLTQRQAEQIEALFRAASHKAK